MIQTYIKDGKKHLFNKTQHANVQGKTPFRATSSHPCFRILLNICFVKWVRDIKVKSQYYQ